MTEAERLAERLEELLAKAEQEDDDIRYYSGSSSKYAPHRDALNIAMSEALPVLLSALRSQAEELERLREFVRSLRDHKNPDLWFLEEPARAALGER